ncbi:MAG: MBL fold metallo-hydrolase, partial [Candidatus Saccharimonadales bacterium]
PTLGNRGDLIHNGKSALAIDVQRDYTRWLDTADKAGVTITHVLETHIHNDYVTGGYKLAQEVHAEYILPEGSGQKFKATIVKDNMTFVVGDIKVTALHTPGHTPHHMSYSVTDGHRTAVYTGGGLLYGTVGRTDLISENQTKQLTADQFESAHKLIETLPVATEVYPTHGFGSFCSSSDGSGATASTLESEARINVALTHNKETFVAIILRGLGPYPRYYAHMGSMNQSGPGATSQLHIHDYAPEDIAQALKGDKSWVVDVRSRKAFAAKHPNAAVGIELGNSFATYTGWLLPWSDDITLVGDTEEDIVSAHIELSRIGMDAFVSGATYTLEPYFAAAPSRSYQRRTFVDLQRALQDEEQPFILDVRLPSDWNDSHVTSSVNIPLHELMARVEELPKYKAIWVHCASGYRASIAASLIDRSGRTPVLIDDTFEHALELGLAS